MVYMSGSLSSQLAAYRVITNADCPVVALVVPAVLTLVIAPAECIVLYCYCSILDT